MSSKKNKKFFYCDFNANDYDIGMADYVYTSLDEVRKNYADSGADEKAPVFEMVLVGYMSLDKPVFTPVANAKKEK